MFFGRKSPQTSVVQIDGNVMWHVARDPDSDTWIGVCQMLNLTAAGDTYADLQACMGEAMGLLFADLLADSELDQFLRERGWRLHSQLPPAGVAVQFDMAWDVARVHSARELVPA